MKLINSVLILFFALTMIGCGTIFKGSTRDINLNSNPAGATITINGVNRGVTPQTLSLQRNSNHQVEFTRDGYESVTFEITRNFDFATTIVGNLFSWGLLGVVVDLASGAAYSLSPEDLTAHMEALRANNIIPVNLELGEDEVFIFMVSTEEWQALTAE